MTSLIPIEFYADAGFSLNQNLNRPTFRLPSRTLIEGFKIVHSEIPLSFYTFSQSTNKLYLQETSGGVVTVSLPVGNYTPTTLDTALTNALTSASPSLSAYNVTYSSQTNKLSITAPVQFRFIFGTLTTTGTLGAKYMGFDTTTSTAYGTSMTLPYVLNLSGPSYLYVHSPQISKMLYRTNIVTSDEQRNSVIGRIALANNMGEFVFFEDKTPIFTFPQDRLDTFELYFTYGEDPTEIVDFNGLKFSMHLRFYQTQETIYA